MALDMTPEQREIGQKNFQHVAGKLGEASPPPGQQPGPGMTRRSFMKGLMAAGAALPIGAAAYFGYQRLHGRPIKAGLIGSGDEGGVLIGEHNPEFVEFVAVADIRPYNQNRIFEGERDPGPGRLWRKGFNRIYGSNARQRIRLYGDNYEDLLADPEIEMVVIALPLHLHQEAAIKAMRAGKHVLCEKLMAWNIAQCKEMIRVAKETDRLLAIGHQRHYNLLYAQATELLNAGVLGDVHHIRALWHRNTTMPGRDGWRPPIRDVDRNALADLIRSKYHYKSMEELVRWRLFQRTGGGLMAELGSHQLDACSIFLNKKHPLAVSGVGGKFFYHDDTDDREVEDHVFCSFEFPGKHYDPTKPRRNAQGRAKHSDIVVVNYSSISTNDFEKYGECVMGPRGTLVVEQEATAMLWPAAGRSTLATVTVTPAGQAPAETSSTWGATETATQQRGQQSLGGGVPSRGYREEMEHLAYCIRMRDEGMARDRDDLQPRCPGKAAMADAIIALTSNKAMRLQQRIEFKEEWFDPDSREVPDDLPVEQV